jgi:plasmid maintenance system antidote protein VapI
MMTKRKPVSVGEMLQEEFMKPLHLTQTALAAAMASSAGSSMNCATIAAP